MRQPLNTCAGSGLAASQRSVVGARPTLPPSAFASTPRRGPSRSAAVSCAGRRSGATYRQTRKRPSSSTISPAWTHGLPAGSRSAAAPSSTTRAGSGASTATTVTPPGSASCRSGSSAGGLRGLRSQRLDTVPARSQRHDSSPRWMKQGRHGPVRHRPSWPRRAADAPSDRARHECADQDRSGALRPPDRPAAQVAHALRALPAGGTVELAGGQAGVERPAGSGVAEKPATLPSSLKPKKLTPSSFFGKSSAASVPSDT